MKWLIDHTFYLCLDLSLDLCPSCRLLASSAPDLAAANVSQRSLQFPTKRQGVGRRGLSNKNLGGSFRGTRQETLLDPSRVSIQALTVKAHYPTFLGY